jgi:hypothetical protein
MVLLFCHCSVFVQSSSPNFHAFINYATRPGVLGFNGRLFRFSNDTLVVMSNENGYFQHDYDTMYYKLSNGELNKIEKTIRSIDSVQSKFNFCIIDGLRLYFSCGIDSVNHGGFLENIYDKKVFLFVNIINNHVPKSQQIRYHKREMTLAQNECLAEFSRGTN